MKRRASSLLQHIALVNGFVRRPVFVPALQAREEPMPLLFDVRGQPMYMPAEAGVIAYDNYGNMVPFEGCAGIEYARTQPTVVATASESERLLVAAAKRLKAESAPASAWFGDGPDGVKWYGDFRE